MIDSKAPRFYPLPVQEDADHVRLQAWVQLARTFYRIERRISTLLTEQSMTMAQFDVLATLRYSEGITQQELAELLLVTKGNVCGLLDRLEKQHWVERRPDAHDGRTNRIHLTATGRSKIESALPAHDRLVQRTMDCLSEADLRQLQRMLKQLEKPL